MSDNTLVSRVRKLTPEQLDAELASHEHNDIGRHIILQEKTRRAVIEAARPHWIVRASFAVALIAAVFAGISALPEIRSWLRGSSASVHPAPAALPTPTAQPVATLSTSALAPDYGARPTDACKQTIQDHYHRIFGPHLAFQFEEPTQASVDDPERLGQKIHGWLFEARWNFKPPAKSNFPMAGRYLARSDTVILTAPIAGPFERWDAKVARDEGKKP